MSTVLLVSVVSVLVWSMFGVEMIPCRLKLIFSQEQRCCMNRRSKQNDMTVLLKLVHTFVVTILVSCQYYHILNIVFYVHNLDQLLFEYTYSCSTNAFGILY